MELFIILPSFVDTTRSQQTTLYRFVSSIWNSYFIREKIEWTAEQLMQKVKELSRADFYVFTDENAALECGKEHKNRNDGKFYPSNSCRFSDSKDDLVDEMSASLMISVNAEYDPDEYCFHVNSIKAATLLSDYYALTFSFSTTFLHPALQTFSADKVVEDKLIDAVNSPDSKALKQILAMPWARDSINRRRYQMVIPTKITNDFPAIFEKFRDNSYTVDGGVSYYEEVSNTNEHATILFQAVFNNDIEKSALLVNNGADIDMICNRFTPLRLAQCFQNKSLIATLMKPTSSGEEKKIENDDNRERLAPSAKSRKLY